jgi:hypothetical protein
MRNLSLKGEKTFKKARACILEICLDELHEGQPNFSDIFSLMNDLGFKYAGNLDQICAPDGRVIYINAVFVKTIISPTFNYEKI